MRLAIVGDYTPLQQYVLGWLACDGHFAKSLRSVRLQLQERDESVLRLFCEAFGARVEPKTAVVKGYRYRRAARNGPFCRTMVALFGRLKRDKQFPADATVEFVAGCFDADGSFCTLRNVTRSPVVHFQHESAAFMRGLCAWLRVNGVVFRARGDRPLIEIERPGCRTLSRLYDEVPFALARKRAVLVTAYKFSPRWWTFDEVERLRANANRPTKELAAMFGVTEKAARLKLWKVRHGYNRQESIPAY